MSLMTPSNASALCRMVVRNSRCCSLIGVSSSKPVMPTMAFIGVRISWLVLARNSDLTLADSSAASRASASSASASFSAVMSLETPSVPTISPSALRIGILVVSTQPSRPSFHVSFSVLPMIACPVSRMACSSLSASRACSSLKKSASVFPTASPGSPSPKSLATARLIIRNRLSRSLK